MLLLWIHPHHSLERYVADSLCVCVCVCVCVIYGVLHAYIFKTLQSQSCLTIIVTSEILLASYDCNYILLASYDLVRYC